MDPRNCFNFLKNNTSKASEILLNPLHQEQTTRNHKDSLITYFKNDTSLPRWISGLCCSEDLRILVFWGFEDYGVLRIWGFWCFEDLRIIEFWGFEDYAVLRIWGFCCLGNFEYYGVLRIEDFVVLRIWVICCSKYLRIMVLKDEKGLKGWKGRKRV